MIKEYFVTFIYLILFIGQANTTKMKKGYHPDLVDGKKVSNRYNRLDPISAKSMPPTGNPHIDKKVKAARKKPK